MRGVPESLFGNALSAERFGRRQGGADMAKKTKKPKMVMVISVKPPGGKAPKKPTDTANVDKAGGCGTGGVKKSMAQCRQCGARGVSREGCRRCSFGPAERFVLQGANNINDHQREMLRQG